MSLPLKTTLYVTAVGILTYWIAVFSGMFPVVDIVPGYRNWFMSFPMADLWIAAMALLSATAPSSNKPLSTVAMAAAGSGLIFLGLYAFAYGVNTGLVYNVTADEAIEIAIKIYCLTVGGWFVMSAYRQAKRLVEQLADQRPDGGRY